MFISIESNSGAIYDRIADAITERIATGEIVQGQQLPAARDLADALGLNAHTVLHAFQRLRDDGLVELRRGRGAVVIGAPAVQAVHEAVAAAVETARRTGVGVAALVALTRREYRA